MTITRVAYGEDSHRLLFIDEPQEIYAGGGTDVGFYEATTAQALAGEMTEAQAPGAADLAFSESYKPLILAKTTISPNCYVKAKSDGDILLHALCRALESLSAANVLGSRAEQLLAEHCRDSAEYLQLALRDLENSSWGKNTITQVSIAIEAKEPKLLPHFASIRRNLLQLFKQTPVSGLVHDAQVGITAMTGDSLSDCGRGQGMAVKVLLTVQTELDD